MEKRINIARILKDCPKGTKLYSPLCGECELDEVSWASITLKDTDGLLMHFFEEGNYRRNGECMIFPSKENRDWSKFQIPFKDGDILVSGLGNPFIFKKLNEYNNAAAHCALNPYDSIIFDNDNWTEIEGCRFATEEEKQKLFDAIKAKGYKWNSFTKNLEKLCESKFKEGDIIVSSFGTIAVYSHSTPAYAGPGKLVHYKCILKKDGTLKIENDFGIGCEIDCRLANQEEKQKLIDALKNKGYSLNIFNIETNTSKKQITPKFKVGDIIKYIVGTELGGIITEITPDDFYKVKCGNVEKYINISVQDRYELVIPKFKVGNRIKQIGFSGYYIIQSIEFDRYILHTNQFLKFENEHIYELVPNKFDITTLKTFDKVLVRSSDNGCWSPQFFSKFRSKSDFPFECTYNSWRQCIPYEGNEYLSGTTDDCEEFYKNW